MTDRNNPEDAYQAFLAMDQQQWLGLLMSLASGGVLTVAEQEGFERAVEDRQTINIQCPQCGETVDTLQASEFNVGELTDEDRHRGFMYDDAPCDTCINEEEQTEAEKA